MTELVLTARSEGRNERHARIAVFQNGAKAGVLTVEAEHEGAVLGAINAHAELLEALKQAFARIMIFEERSDGHFDSFDVDMHQIRHAIAHAQGPAADYNGC